MLGRLGYLTLQSPGDAREIVWPRMTTIVRFKEIPRDDSQTQSIRLETVFACVKSNRNNSKAERRKAVRNVSNCSL